MANGIGRGAGTYGNMPPNMFKPSPKASEPAMPTNRGLSGKAAPDKTKTGIIAPVNPGLSGKSQPMLTGVPGGSSEKLTPRSKEGAPQTRKAPLYAGVGKRGKSTMGKPDKMPKKNARIAKPDKSDGMMSPGNPYSTPKAAKKQGLTSQTYHL